MKKTIEHLELQIMNLTHDVYSKKEVEEILNNALGVAKDEKEAASEDFTEYTDRIRQRLSSEVFDDGMDISLGYRNEVQVTIDVEAAVRTVLDELNSVWEG